MENCISSGAGNPDMHWPSIAEDLFVIPEIPYLRIRKRRENDKATGSTRLYQNGSSFTENRDN